MCLDTSPHSHKVSQFQAKRKKKKKKDRKEEERRKWQEGENTNSQKVAAPLGKARNLCPLETKKNNNKLEAIDLPRDQVSPPGVMWASRGRSQRLVCSLRHMKEKMI